MHLSFLKKKKWNGIMAMVLPKWEGKKNLQLVCGNVIAEIGGKKKFAIVAIPMPKMGRKKNATSTIFLQHFHNKSHVISYY